VQRVVKTLLAGRGHQQRGTSQDIILQDAERIEALLDEVEENIRGCTD
jgi:hypothetical protein